MLTSEQIASPDRPVVSPEFAVDFVHKHYGFRVIKVKEFESYGDKNFYVQVEAPLTADNNAQRRNKKTEFVLKILNSVDSADEEIIQAQTGAMFFLKERGISCSFPVLSLCGKYTVFEKDTDNVNIQDCFPLKTNAIRLMDYIPGQPLSDAYPSSYPPQLLYSIGQYIARFDQSLKDYSNQRLEGYMYSWDMQQIHQLQPYINAKYLGSKQRVDLILNVYQKYTSIVSPVLSQLDKQVIHNDVNDRNIIVPETIAGALPNQEFSIIDFGDMCYSYRVFEVAIAMSDVIVRQFIRADCSIFESVGFLLRGYQSTNYPLSREELGLIYWCIAGRLLQRLVIGSVKLSMEPENKYVNDQEMHIWDVLPQLLSSGDNLLDTWMNV